MRRLRRAVLPAWGAMALWAGFWGAATAAPAVSAVGTLNCEVEGQDVALHFGSNRAIRCIYQPDAGGRRQIYEGQFQKYGVEVGVIGNTAIRWRVLAPSARIPRGALAGLYRGFTIEATVGAGSGANILVREGQSDIRLDLGMQAQTGGLNAAVGVTSLELWPVRR